MRSEKRENLHLNYNLSVAERNGNKRDLHVALGARPPGNYGRDWVSASPPSRCNNGLFDYLHHLLILALAMQKPIGRLAVGIRENWSYPAGLARAVPGQACAVKNTSMLATNHQL
jgi:hypothetical protein